MSFLQRVFHRRPSHEEWLAGHPGKGTTHTAPAAINEAEQQRIRDQMEGELDKQRTLRGQE